MFNNIFCFSITSLILCFLARTNDSSIEKVNNLINILNYSNAFSSIIFMSVQFLCLSVIMWLIVYIDVERFQKEANILEIDYDFISVRYLPKQFLNIECMYTIPSSVLACKDNWLKNISFITFSFIDTLPIDRPYFINGYSIIHKRL